MGSNITTLLLGNGLFDGAWSFHGASSEVFELSFFFPAPKAYE